MSDFDKYDSNSSSSSSSSYADAVTLTNSMDENEVINLDGDEMNSNKKSTIFDMMKSSKVLKKSEKYDLLNSAINDSNFKNYFKQTDPNYAEVMKALTPISSVHNSTS